MLEVGAHLCANHNPILIFHRAPRDFESQNVGELPEKDERVSPRASAGRPSLGWLAYQFRNLQQIPMEMRHTPNLTSCRRTHANGHNGWLAGVP